MLCVDGVVLIDAIVKLFIKPTVVLLSSTADDDVLNMLDPSADARGSERGSGVLTLLSFGPC